MGSRTIITKSLTTNTSKTPTSGRYNSKTTTTAKYNSRTSSSTTYTSGTRTTVNHYSSRTPSESSANNYDAALQARLEAERKKRIQENKAYIEKIQRTNEEVKETRSMIAEAQALLASAVGGVKYGEYSKYLTSQDEMLQQMTKGLNSCGEKAATNIRDDGEEYIFNQTNTNPNNNNTNNNKKILSANTDKLRELESLLDNISKKTKSIDDTMIGFSNASNRLGITNSGNVKENSQDLLINTVELKMKVKQQIQDIEKTEKENLNIIGRIADWFGNLFKAPDKEQKPQTGTTVSTRTTTRTPTSTRITTSTTNNARTRTRTPITNPTRTRTMNVNSYELKEMAEIFKLAEQYGIPTSGKSQREILEALAIKLGISTSVDSSQKNSRFWRYPID